MVDNNEEQGSWLGVIMLIAIIFIISIMYFSYAQGWGCHIQSVSKDKYCIDESNWRGSHSWKVRSHEKDRINSEKAAEEKIVWDERYEKKISCYNKGYDYNESFDIFEDYNLTCSKVAYINDHLMDNFEKVDGGYIKGSYSGFLSSGYVEGKSYDYINDRVIATGKLIEKIEYHVDCENLTKKWTLQHGWPGKKFVSEDTTKIDYFTEEEFVMTYVNRCID